MRIEQPFSGNSETLNVWQLICFEKNSTYLLVDVASLYFQSFSNNENDKYMLILILYSHVSLEFASLPLHCRLLCSQF